MQKDLFTKLFTTTTATCIVLTKWPKKPGLGKSVQGAQSGGLPTPNPKFQPSDMEM
jgi:hypothetical protein